MLVDWLPWNHTFGGNHDFNLILKRGGTLYIDAGRPAPPLIAAHGAQPDRGRADDLLQRARRLRRAAAVPGAATRALRARFFERLGLIFYAAAALPQDLWTRLRGASPTQERGEPVLMTVVVGADRDLAGWPPRRTSRSPARRDRRAGAGREIKLAPVERQARDAGRGARTSRPATSASRELTAAAFDEDGFYRTGDAGKLEDPRRPDQGLRVRRPRGRGLQAHDRDVRSGRQPAHRRSPPPRRC